MSHPQKAQNLPPVRGGLGMIDDANKESNEDVMWWRFSHNKDYQETQGLRVLSSISRVLYNDGI